MSDAKLSPCLLEIDFFDDSQASEYLKRRLPVLASARQSVELAYHKFSSAFFALATETRLELMRTPGGNDKRFAGYAPVLDAICVYALDEEQPNPSARLSDLTVASPVTLLGKISASILNRESGKLVRQLRRKHPTIHNIDWDSLYSPDEQLGRISSYLFGAPAPRIKNIPDQEVRDAYELMVAEFAPQHPFLDARLGPSNAAFAAHVSVWAITTGYAREGARKALRSHPMFGSGLFFELYMDWVREKTEQNEDFRIDLVDVAPLYASFASQAVQGDHPSLEIMGEDGDPIIEVQFDMQRADPSEADDARSYGPYPSVSDSILEFRNGVGGIRAQAPISMIIGDGRAVSVTAPVELDVETLEIDGRELRVFKSVSRSGFEGEQVSFSARDAIVSKVERILLHGAKLSVAFENDRTFPWTDYAVIPPTAPNEGIAVARRRARRILTSFRSHSKGALRRLAAKIDHARMMKNDDIGRTLLAKFLSDKIIVPVEIGKFYELNPGLLAEKFGMDYQAIQQQFWTEQADNYLEGIG